MLSLDFRQSIKTLDEAENLYGMFLKAGAGSAGDFVSWFPYLLLLLPDPRPPVNLAS
jgi:hypothetical protein